MSGETGTARKRRASLVLKRLARTYPDAHCELDYESPLQLLIATILSAQCTDRQVNLVTPALFERYSTAQDYARAGLEELESALRRIGLFRSKARNIRACCARLVANFDGEVPRTMAALTSLAGVGRKTANVILGNAFGLAEGIVVDTHVARLSRRLEFTRQSAPDRIETELQALVPRKQWTMTSHWLIWHGRRRCRARRPDCPACEVRSWCPSASEPND